MNITIFTFAKPERQTISHSSGQRKHSRSVTRAATRHRIYRIIVCLSSSLSSRLDVSYLIQTKQPSVGHFACTKQWRNKSCTAQFRKLDSLPPPPPTPQKRIKSNNNKQQQNGTHFKTKASDTMLIKCGYISAKCILRSITSISLVLTN